MGEVPVRESSQVRVVEDIANTMTHRHSRKDETAVHGNAVHQSRKVEAGYDIFDNNAINLLMASIMSVGGMLVAGLLWDVPIQGMFS